MDVTWKEMFSLCMAVVFGAMIGLEREIHKKNVGLRTNTLICLGAAIFTVVSRQMAVFFGGSPSRIAAQIVGGIGFLGAGAIIRDRGSVQGATTAATIWLVASIGMACGAGFLVLASASTALTVLVLLGLSPIERRLFKYRQASSTGAGPAEQAGP
jgi:putative Mg2+ transporter-C (MgtC) family protein